MALTPSQEIPTPADGEEVAEAPPSPGDSEPHPTRILVVDDDPAVVEMLCLLLSEAGIATAGAYDANAGLEMLRSGTWDALFTDREMPGVNGDELSKAVKCLFPKVRIVMVTGWPPSKEECKTLALPLDAIVTKPFTFESLLDALQDAPSPSIPELVLDLGLDMGGGDPAGASDIHAQKLPAPDKALTAALNTDFDALRLDLERAQNLAVDAQAQLNHKSRESEALRLLLQKSTQDLGQLRIAIDELRKERHFFANEAMRAVALEIRIADLTVERDWLRAELDARVSRGPVDFRGAA